jgi:hypothetical protein
MKREFADIHANVWLHGRLGQSARSFCLQADAAACDVLLAAVEELEAARPPARRKLTFVGRQHPHSYPACRLALVEASERLKAMYLREEKQVAVWEFTPRGVAVFRGALELLRKGTEDFGIDPSDVEPKKQNLGTQDLASAELWFWTPYMDP